MGLLLVAGLVAVVTTTALTEGLHIGSVVRSGRGRWDGKRERWIGVLVAGRKNEKRENRGKNMSLCTVDAKVYLALSSLYSKYLESK